MTSFHTFLPFRSLALTSDNLASNLSRKWGGDELPRCGTEKRREEVAKLTPPAPSRAQNTAAFSQLGGLLEMWERQEE